MHPRDPAPVFPTCEPEDPLQIETFAIEDRAARALFRRWPPHLGLDPGFDQVPHLLFLGIAPPARALLLQALLLAHYGQGRPRISLVCDRHEAVAAELLAAYPQASFIADLRFSPLEELSSLLRPADAPDLNSPPLANPPVTLAVVCLEDDPRPHRDPAAPRDPGTHPDPDLGASVQTPPLPELGSVAQTPDSLAPSPLAGEGWGEGAEGLHVSAPRDRPPSDLANHSGLALAHRLIEALATSQGVSPPVLLEVGAAEPEGGIEDWDGQIIPFDYQREACRAALLLDGAGDELARTIHEHYRDTIAAQGRDLTQEPAGQPWERLATSYRQANRHQADHVWAKLAVTDCRAVAEDLVEVFALTPLEVERLAIVEHARWAADRYLDGWSYGPVRDNARKLHPQLIPYAELSEAMKDLDRFAVRGLPTLAARLGLGIQRLLILGIHPPGPACPSGKPLQRLATGLRERLRERYPDRALVIAATLADHRERDLVRELMEGAEGASLFLLLPHPLSHLLARLSPTAARREFLTLLAQAERRISLRGEGELAAWFARRAEIQLILGETLPCLGDATSAPGKASDTESRAVRVMTGLAGGSDKRILLDPDGPGLTWTFDY
ncbi:MAG: Ryanodine receptor Ryr [Chromatiaceae bacterium]|nr:Ryanodine receptor Ryr [Chromatiaceae bacterium]